MKKIFIITVLSLVCAMQLYGQDYHLSPETTAFRTYCISVATGVQNKNVKLLETCLNNYSYTCIPLEKKASFTKKDSTAETNCRNHCLFMPEYVDDMLVTMETVKLRPASLLRDEDGIDFYYYVGALKPKSSATYSMEGTGDIEIFAVSEKCGDMNLCAVSVVQQKQGAPIMRMEYKSIPDKMQKSPYLSWTMYNENNIEVTVENTSEEDVSFILVIKS